MKRLLAACCYSWHGFKAAWEHEAAFRQEIVVTIVAIMLAFYFPLSAYERLWLIGVWMLVLIVELLNSGLEATLDRISLEKNDLIKRAKDWGSAAVLLALLLAIASWATVLWRVFSAIG